MFIKCYVGIIGLKKVHNITVCIAQFHVHTLHDMSMYTQKWLSEEATHSTSQEEQCQSMSRMDSDIAKKTVSMLDRLKCPSTSMLSNTLTTRVGKQSIIRMCFVSILA